MAQLERASGNEIGIDLEQLSGARGILLEGIEAGEYPGAVLLVERHRKVATVEALGRLSGEGTSCVAENTIYDIASVTKPVSTASSLMILVERGQLDMAQPVQRFFPECDLRHLAGVTLHHLTTHTSGLPGWRDFYSAGQTREQVIEGILREPLQAPPGTKYEYSCLGYILLGAIIEKTSGMSLAQFAYENLLKPLGMHDTCFNPPVERRVRIAPTANRPMHDGTLCGVVHDGNASAMDGVSGNAGLFSTAADLAVYGRMLLNGGEYAGARILSKASVELMLSPQIPSEIGGQTYGLFAHPNEMMICAAKFSDKVVGHSGFTGTLLLVDPVLDTTVVLLTNRVYMEGDGTAFLKRRRPLNALIASALT